MTCKENSNIILRFPRIGLEIQPYTVDFRVDDNKFDYLDAKFSSEVGDYFEPYMEDESDILHSPQPVQVVMDGVVSHRMYYRPDNVTFGTTNFWVELHDPLKHLKYTVVDYKLSDIKAKEAYKTVFEDANKADILTDITFNVPSAHESYIAEDTEMQLGMDPIEVSDEAGDSGFSDAPGDVFHGIQGLWQDYDEQADRRDSQTVLDTTYNFNLKNKTCLEAIFFLNDKLGLQAWSDHEGVLRVGLNIRDSNHHVAAANDSRVWSYRNAELTPPGTEVKMAVVQGGMVDAPNSTKEEDALGSVGEFLNPLDSHENDLIAQGVAQRPDITDGKIVSVDEPNLGRDGLETRAYHILANEMMNNNAGTVEINPASSGTRITDWRNIQLGDFIQLIPSQKEDCKDIERTLARITGIKHTVDGGSWKIKLNIKKWNSPPAKTRLRYFSPESNNYYDEDYNQIITADHA